MRLKDICSYLDTAIPISFQEDYDNSGLQTGYPEKEITKGLLAVDVTEQIVDEAIAESADIIISHHPVVFRGLKKLTGDTVTERILLKSVRNEIAIYSAHTNLDMIAGGVSKKMADKLGLQNVKVLVPLKNRLLKLVTFIPEAHLSTVSDAVFNAGAGVIGNYDRCSFSLPGTGTFRPGEGTKPFTGVPGEMHFEKEVRFETIMFDHLKHDVIKALLAAHPYEEVAYDIYPLENDNIEIGLGCSGEFSDPVTEEKFLEMLSQVFGAKGIRYSGPTGRLIRKAALCGGAGASLLKDAIGAGADAFVTADIKYHTFFEAENRILLVDCGHYESEKNSTEIIYDLIIKKFPTFALRFSKSNTNPINYH
ncbi:MAG: Nif3-like dinuclear metal center hexameric protein [Bacteroidales bacterium]